jgi:hypothetical protein
VREINRLLTSALHSSLSSKERLCRGDLTGELAFLPQDMDDMMEPAKTFDWMQEANQLL